MSRLFLPLVLLLAAGCGRRQAAAGEERVQTLDGLVLRQSENGRPSWTLRARLAVLREDQKKAVLSDPAMEFLRDGKVVSRVTAAAGEVDTETRDVRLSQSVALDSLDDASRLTTEELLFSSARQRFRTDREVLVKRPDATLRGSGLEATPDLSEIRVFNQRTDIKERPR
ncbi:MAG: LPS export ABC transporter periplasmic protein LptC [Elusimicrobiota bacterium]|nr:LPS export ABC transporter periplasmic protein LptC [Elusimicrobiota bacterium]